MTSAKKIPNSDFLRIVRSPKPRHYGRINLSRYKSCYLVKAGGNEGRAGYICLGTVTCPKDLIGKKVGVFMEVLDANGEGSKIDR